MAGRHIAWRGSVVLGLTLAALGCVTQPPPPPAPPPAPMALTITAQRGQSQAQQNQDKAQCQSQASRFARSSAEWAQMFAQCMSGRGYLVQ
jgi:hypothetical protein